MKRTIADLVKKTVSELEKDLLAVRGEVMKLKIESKVKPQKDTNLVIKKKRVVAQILTVLNEKKQFESDQKKEEHVKN